MKLLPVFFILLSTLWLSGCSNLTSLLFYPQSQYLRTPTDLELEYEQVEIKAEDGTELVSWFLPGQEPLFQRSQLQAFQSAQVPHTARVPHTAQQQPPIVLFLHGNAENISTHIGSVYWLPEQGVDVFLLDYRGFGHSKGSPFIPAVFQDVEASLIWLRQRFPERRVYILGQSIGAAIATTSMAMFKDEYEISGLILDASLTGYQDIAQEVLGRSPITWIAWPLAWLLPTKWDPLDYIEQISPKPILMFHSQADAVLPYDSGRALFEQAKEPKAWYESKGGHIQSFNYQEYRDVLLDFIILEKPLR